jgi:predicted Zn-dependent protease with MMP-like domain
MIDPRKGIRMPLDDDAHALIARIDELIAADRLEDALEVVEDTLSAPPDDLREEELAQIEFEQLALLFELGDPSRLLAAVRQYDVTDPAAALFEVRAHLLRWDVETAKTRLRELRADTEGEAGLDADRLELEAVIDDLEGRYEESDRKLRRANKKAPEEHPLPVRLDPAEAQAVLERALAELPENVRASLQNLIVEIVPMPRIEPIRESGVTSPWILGLYTGFSALERDATAPDPLPPRVQIYQRNLERTCADLDEMQEELRVTLLHEIGHHLGFDEDGVAGLGLE